MHLPVLLSLLAAYFGAHHQSPNVFVCDCMNQSGWHFGQIQYALHKLMYLNFFLNAENVELMKEASSLSFRLSVVQLSDNNNLIVDYAVQTLLRATRYISPVGILFNYDCAYSKSFIFAVSRNANSTELKRFAKFLYFSVQMPGALPSNTSG